MQNALKDHEGYDEIKISKDSSMRPIVNVQQGEASMESESDFEKPASKRKRTNRIGGAGSPRSAATKIVVVGLTMAPGPETEPT